jgi:aminoglycoside phosphotransferase (APT) family kinase protein
VATLRNLGEMIRQDGKVGVIVWGPATDGDPERAFAKIIDELHLEIHATEELAGLDRASLAAMFERAGLAVVRHTIVMHPLVFQRAERFAMSLLSARTYGPQLVKRGEEHVAAALARFYERVAAQDEPISYSPAATIVVAAHPGAEVELPHRPSVRVPT